MYQLDHIEIRRSSAGFASIHSRPGARSPRRRGNSRATGFSAGGLSVAVLATGHRRGADLDTIRIKI